MYVSVSLDGRQNTLDMLLDERSSQGATSLAADAISRSICCRLQLNKKGNIVAIVTVPSEPAGSIYFYSTVPIKGINDRKMSSYGVRIQLNIFLLQARLFCPRAQRSRY